MTRDAHNIFEEYREIAPGVWRDVEDVQKPVSSGSAFAIVIVQAENSVPTRIGKVWWGRLPEKPEVVFDQIFRQTFVANENAQHIIEMLRFSKFSLNEMYPKGVTTFKDLRLKSARVRRLGSANEYIECCCRRSAGMFGLKRLEMYFYVCPAQYTEDPDASPYPVVSLALERLLGAASDRDLMLFKRIHEAFARQPIEHYTVDQLGYEP